MSPHDRESSANRVERQRKLLVPPGARSGEAPRAGHDLAMHASAARQSWRGRRSSARSNARGAQGRGEASHRAQLAIAPPATGHPSSRHRQEHRRRARDDRCTEASTWLTVRLRTAKKSSVAADLGGRSPPRRRTMARGSFHATAHKS
jgi:hypothetical protein